MQYVELYYQISFLLSVILTFIYAAVWHKHYSVFFSLLYAFIPVVNLGYVFRVGATNLEEALLATRIIYLGGSFLILFITFCIFTMCQVSLPRWLSAGMIFLNMTMYLVVLTIGKTGLFYSEVYAEVKEGILILHKKYALLHTVYYAILLMYFIMGFAVIAYSYFRKKQVSRRIIALLFIPEVVTVFPFFGIRMFTIDFELTPGAYVISQLMYLMIVHYICMYNIEDTAIDSLMETGDTGFISIDFRMKYLGSNETARRIFPGLNDLTVDRSLDRNARINEIFSPWLSAFDRDETKDKYYYPDSEGRIYLVDINYLFHNGRKRGYQLVISDDTKNQKYIELLGNYNTNLEREVREKTSDIVRMHNNLIRSMAVLVESRDNSTGGHIIRTSDVVGILLEEIMKDPEFTSGNGITEKFRDDLIKAAPLHDIGKIAVDDEILRKPGRFTPEEFEQMKLHAPEGAKVLHSILADTDDERFKVLAENVAHYHHERVDGSGYPDGLKGRGIPVEARIMAIADVYDALVSKRVYKDRMSFEKADSIMRESMGKHFDKRLEKYYTAALPRIESYYREKDREEQEQNS